MAAQLLLHSKGLSWKSRGGCRCQSYSSALQPLNRNTWAGLKEREVGWRERGEGGEECLLETEEEKKSYSARSLLKHGHPPPAPRQLRSSAFPAAEQPRAGPGHSTRRLPPLHRPSAPFWSPWSQPLQLFGFSLYRGLSAIRAIYEWE